MRDLTQHLTARADDSHAAPVLGLPEGHPFISEGFPRCQAWVRFFALLRLNHMLHRLCGPPSISLSFNLATVLPRRGAYRVSYGTETYIPAPSTHRLQRGLPGYLILFATHAFAPQRQLPSRWPPSPPVFLQISTDFTPTPGIPPPSPVLKPGSIKGSSTVGLWDFTPDLPSRLRALYAQ